MNTLRIEAKKIKGEFTWGFASINPQKLLYRQIYLFNDSDHYLTNYNGKLYLLQARENIKLRTIDDLPEYNPFDYQLNGEFLLKMETEGLFANRAILLNPKYKWSIKRDKARWKTNLTYV